MGISVTVMMAGKYKRFLQTDIEATIVDEVFRGTSARMLTCEYSMIFATQEEINILGGVHRKIALTL